MRPSRRPTCSTPPRWTNGPSWTARARWTSPCRQPGWAQEKAEVDLLLNLARETEAQGTDAKAEALLELIYKLQQEENDPALKVLVFTEFVPTQAMLAGFLESRGFSVALLNGSMDLDARTKAQQAFARDVRVLISTDAGGEGLNLQFCHVVVNFDMPWNPMRLEQRIGRVDRIGQRHVVRAINFVLEDTVEHRVRQVLEEKLAVIAEEFGVDKASDVMDSVEAEPIFDELFVHGPAGPGVHREGVRRGDQPGARQGGGRAQEQRLARRRARAGAGRRPQVARPPGAVLAGARDHDRLAGPGRQRSQER